MKNVKFYNSQTMSPTNRRSSAYHQWYQYHRLKSTAAGYKALQSGEHSPKFLNILLHPCHSVVWDDQRTHVRKWRQNVPPEYLNID